MNQVAIRKEQPGEKLMLLAAMADKYLLAPDEFSKTVRATCGLATATAEQFAAFLIVAKTYGLNPVTREIYAFPSRGGGIVPIVSIDGWINLVNTNPHCDGFDFEMEHVDGKLVSATCTMHRKDRAHPVVVTEYLSECRRSTEPWKMEHRMLRHKALIQAARYAFGFAGIYDEDEGRTIAEAVDVTPKERPRVPSPSEAIEHQPETVQVKRDANGTNLTVEKPDPISSGPQFVARQGVPDIQKDYDGWFSWALDRIQHEEDAGALESFFVGEIEVFSKDIFPSDLNDLASAYSRTQERLNADQ